MRKSSKVGKLSGIYLRGKQFWFRYRHNGHQYRVSLQTSDAAEAVLRAMAIRDDPVLSGANTLKREIDAYVTRQLEMRKFTRNSAENRRAVLRCAADFFEVTEPARLSAEDVRRWYDWLKHRPDRPLTESTAQSYVMMLRGFLRSMVEQNKLRDNVAKKIEFAEIRTSARKGFCDKKTVDRLIKNCRRTDLKFVLFCGFHAGMRKEEIIQARREWFDLAGGVIHLQRSDSWEPKDKEDRTIPLTAAFKKFLDKGFITTGPFMLAPAVKQGESRYRWDFRRPFHDYMVEQGTAWVTPHIMRHTFASLLASQGVSIYKIAKWLGDGVEVVQNHYAHLLPKDADIERAFAGT
jgi:integrase